MVFVLRTDKNEERRIRMSEIVYECAVNKTHPQKKFVVTQLQAPVCCEKAMFLLQAAAQGPAPVKPQAAAPTAARPKYEPVKGTSTQKK